MAPQIAPGAPPTARPSKCTISSDTRALSGALQARVTLEIVHFDGRAVGGALEGCARCLMCRCEHILNAKSSRDAFVALRHEP